MRSNRQSPPKGTPKKQGQTTIPASYVGVTLTISRRALAEINRIHEESFAAAHESRHLLWR